MCTVRATSSHITAALTAARASLPIVNGPWLRMSTAGLRDPRSVSTMPRPIESSPMSANGPTGTGPPNSSAIIVRTHGTASPRAAHAVAYVEWVCTTPPTSGMWRYTYAWAAVSDDGARVPSTSVPSRSQTTMSSGVRSS